MPSAPLEKIEFERIASPVPETHVDAVVGVESDRVALAGPMPPIVLPDEPRSATPSISLPSGNCPVMSVPMRLPSTQLADAARRAAVDLDAPVIGRDQVLPVGGGAADRVVPGTLSIRMPCWALGSGWCRSCRCRSRSLRSGRRWPSRVSSIPTSLPEMTCEPAAFPWIVTPLAPSTSTPWKALPRSNSPVMSVPIRLPIDGDPRDRRARDFDADLVGRDDVPRPDLGPRRRDRDPVAALPSAWLPSDVTPIMLYDTMLPVAEAAGDVDAVPPVGRDRVAGAGRAAADRVVRGADDVDAVPGVAGPRVPEHVAAARRHADVSCRRPGSGSRPGRAGRRLRRSPR